MFNPLIRPGAHRGRSLSPPSRADGTAPTRWRAFAGALALATGALLAPGSASAEAFPCKVMKIVAPNPAGGATDVLSRLLSVPLSQRLGVPVIVENRGGASTNIGTAAVVNAAPDGCTLLLGNMSMALNKSLFKLNFDVETDLAAVVQVAAVPMAFFVHPSVPATSIKQLIELSRVEPGKVTYSSAGNGTPGHLLMELVNARAGAQLLHVPYRGAGPSTADVVAGQILSSADSLIPVTPFVKGNRLRALAVTGESRAPTLPDVPTFKELGMQYADISLWYGVMAPAKTSPELVARLNHEFVAVLNDPAVQQRLAALGSVATPQTSESFQKLLRSDAARFGELIKANHITAE